MLAFGLLSWQLLTGSTLEGSRRRGKSGRRFLWTIRVSWRWMSNI
jgi:hypothetical protein